MKIVLQNALDVPLELSFEELTFRLTLRVLELLTFSDQLLGRALFTSYSSRSLLALTWTSWAVSPTT